MGKIFGGGSKTKQQQTTNSTTQSLAYEPIKETYSPLMEYSKTGAESLQRMLKGDMTDFNAYKAGLNYDDMEKQGGRGIFSGRAAQGLLKSGSTVKGMTEYRNNLQNSTANDYLNKLLGLTGVGFNAGQLLNNAGTTTSGSMTGISKQTNKPGLGPLIGQIASSVAASDRRLKKDIERLGELSNGLGVYRYNYISGQGPFIGVMADEVKALKPEALGPMIDGYMTVDYNQLKKEMAEWHSTF